MEKFNQFKIWFKSEWNSSYFVNQFRQILLVLTFTINVFIKRLGISILLILVIFALALAYLNINNTNFSNLRWALIGILGSIFATITVLDAYNKYIKSDSFGLLFVYSMDNIFSNLDSTVKMIASAFIEDYNTNKKSLLSMPVTKNIILELKKNLNSPENINFINGENNYYFEVFPHFYKSIDYYISKIINKSVPILLNYAEEKKFVNVIVALDGSLELFLGIMKIQYDAIKLWYPDKMSMAPIELGNKQNLLDYLNQILDDIYKFLDENQSFNTSYIQKISSKKATN